MELLVTLQLLRVAQCIPGPITFFFNYFAPFFSNSPTSTCLFQDLEISVAQGAGLIGRSHQALCYGMWVGAAAKPVQLQ